MDAPVGATASGWMADRLGRKKPLMISIAWFSVCNFIAGFSPTFWFLLLFRALLGIGMGAEWPAGAALAMEQWPQRSRGLMSGVLQGSWGLGFLASSACYWLLFDRFGWRGMLWIGIAPAVAIVYVRFFVKEPELWVENQRLQKAENRQVKVPLGKIFKRGMRLKDILVFLDAGSASEGRLKLATTIARDHRAHLEAIFLPPGEKAELQPGIGAPLPGWSASRPELSTIEIPKIAMLADIAESRFHDRLRLSGIDGKWQSLHGAKATELIARALAADLIILGQIDPDARSAPALRPEKIVVACGRPALLVPYIGGYTQVGRRVSIAWDGSREAVRALNDALPLIGNAEAVTVMTVRGRDFERDRSSMERVVYHLARHGVAVRPDRVLHGGTAISDVLLSRAVDIAADLIVAGAYHHSQMREALIGGVSRGLFRHMTVPVLMSH